MNDEGEQNLELVASMESDFNKLGITLYDTDGQMKSTFDILSDLAEVYPDLDQNTKNYYAALIGGKTQVDVVNSVISNFNTALEANQAAMNSTGSAMNENSIYMDSLGAKVNQIRSEFEKLSTSLISSDLVGIILSLAKGLLQFANTGVGQTIVKITALITVMALLKVGWTKLTAAVVKYKLINSDVLAILAMTKTSMASATTMTGMLTTGWIGLTAAVKAATAALLSNPLFWGAAIIAGGIAIIKGAVSLFDKLNVTLEEQVEIVKEAQQSYDEAQQKLEENVLALEEKKQKLQEIQDLQNKDSSDKYNIEIDTIKNEISVLEAEKKVLEEIAQLEKDKLQKETIDLLKKTENVTTYKEGFDPYIDWRGNQPYVFGGDIRTEYTHLEKVQVEIDNYNKLLEYSNNLTQKAGQTDENFAKEKKAVQEKLESLRSSIIYTTNDLLKWRDGLDLSTEEGRDYAQQIDSVVETSLDFQDSLNASSNATKKNSNEIDEETQKLIDLNNNAKESANTLKDYLDETNNLLDTEKEFSKVLDGVSSAIDMVTNAYKEQNDEGGLSLETISKLIEKDSNLINYLEVENGVTRLSADAMDYLAGTTIEAARANLELQKNNAVDSLNAAQQAATAAGDAYKYLGKTAIGAAIGRLLEAGAQTDIEKAQAQVDAIQKKIDILDSIQKSASYTGAYKASSKKSSSSSSKTVYQPEIDALYEYNNVLDIAKENVDKFKDELDDAEGYDEQIEKTNQLIEALRKQIAATENLKNAQADQIDNYINQLKQQGFIIDYNRKTNELYIRNMQHLADFSGDGAKEIEKLIKEIQSMNKENRSLDSSIRDLTNDVNEYYDTLADIPEQKLEKFKELMSAFQESQLQDLEDEIKDINHEMENDPRLKALEEQIEALEKENDDIEHQQELEEKLLAIEEAKERLRNAREQKTLQVYKEGEGWTWIVDPDKVKEAQEDLADAQADLSDFVKEDQIAALEAEKEAIEKSYQDRIDVLEDFLDEQNYLIDKSSRETIETLDELMNKMAEFGVDSAANLATVNNWINNYNASLKDMNNTLNNLPNNVSNGLLYNSTMQDKINSALSGNINSTGISSGLALNGLSYSSGTGTDGTNIYIDRIELPNVQNADDFVEALKDLPRLAISQASSRK